jgi:L-iditol 2-dehydrogenase
MKALMKTAPGPGHIELKEVEDPHPGPGEVRIRVHVCGICGTDLHVLHNTTINSPPVILGHEFTGVIDEVGSKVHNFKPGDRVVAETTVESCGSCYYCITGNHNICANRLGLGRTGNGAFADYLILRQEIVHHLPDSIDMTEGALLEPLACTVHAVSEAATIHASDTVLVMGPGAIGLCAMQVAKAEGARVIIAGLKSDQERLDIARSLGADHVITIGQDTLSTAVQELTNGTGVDVVIECSGAAAAVPMALEVLRRQGQYVQMGLSGKELSVSFDMITNRELRLLGSVNSKWTSWERALLLLSEGKVSTKPLISAILPLTQWEEGFHNMEAGISIKTLLQPNPEAQLTGE